MKMRFLYILLCVLVLVGCKDEKYESSSVTRMGVRIFTNSTLTRTVMQETEGRTQVNWNIGDLISLSVGNQKNLCYAATASQSGRTEFVSDSSETLFAENGDTVYAFYPAMANVLDPLLPDSIVRISDYTSWLDLDNPDYTDLLYASGRVENGSVNLQFKHLFTFIKLVFPRKVVEGVEGVSLQSSVPVGGLNLVVSLRSGQIVVENPQNVTSEINLSNVVVDDNNLILYCAILPQPENALLALHGGDGGYLFSRSVPAGGMKAGCMYVMDMNSDRIVQQEQWEKIALVDFYNATGGNAWTNNANWGSDSLLNEWYGLQGVANLVQMDLIENNLDGTLPESFASLLDNANLIDLRGNYLRGVVPESVREHPRWNELGWNIVLQQYPFWNTLACDVTKDTPRSGFDFSHGDMNLHLNDKDIYLIDGSKTKLMQLIGQNKLTQIIVLSRSSIMSSPFDITDRRINLHLDYQNKGFGTIVELGSYWDEPIGEEWKTLASDLPVSNFVFVDERKGLYENFNSIIPLNDKSWLGHHNGDVFLVNAQGDLVDYYMYVSGENNLEEWYCQHIDSVARIYCGEPEEHEIFSRQFYTSTDYSRDGEVVTLQTASQGQGIDLVFMGEAFVDKDMGDGGLYEQKMNEAMEQYFSIEPYKSFRNRFNVYAVKVVSPNAEFATGAKHRINESPEVCFEYVQKVTQRNSAQVPMVSVIYNSLNAGRSYTVMYNDGAFVGYMMEGVNSVLNHEVGGHGFAKLLDEYVEGGNESLTLPQSSREELDNVWENWNWGANVDWRNDYSTVKWAHFLQDSRYAGEGLGLYEGAYLYGFGAYRPTENSMMRYNDSPFNAPSREQIYKTIMQMSEGSDWTYNYEDFVQYDAINRNGVVTRGLQQQPSAQQVEKWRKTHRPPVKISGTWQDAVRNNRQILVPLR